MQPPSNLNDSPDRHAGDAEQSTLHTLNWKLFLVAVFMTAFSTVTLNEADSDLWGHVLYGKEFLRDGHIPMTSTWTFTAVGHPWVNHENLAEIMMAYADAWGGAAGLLLLKSMTTLLLLGVVAWRLLARKCHPVTVGTVLLVLGVAIAFHWHFRPQIFGYACFACMLALFDWVYSGWAGDWWLNLQTGEREQSDETTTDSKSNWWTHVASELPEYSPLRMKFLYLLIPLGIVWVNTHGSFAAGLCIAIAYLGLRSIETLSLWRWSGWGRVRRFMLMATGGVVATFFNPYGPKLLFWLTKSVFTPRPEINDWKPVFEYPDAAIGFWMMVGISVIALARSRRFDFTHTVLLALLAWQGASHIRHIVLFAVAWAFWMSYPIDTAIKAFIEDLKENSPQPLAPPPRNSPAFTYLLSGWMLFVGWSTWPRVTELRVNQGKYPVSAMQFIANNRLNGRMVITFNWAQYALGYFAATDMPSTVAIDGRLRTCYPQEVIDIYFDFILGSGTQQRYRSPNSPPLDPTRALTYESPELILISREQAESIEVLEQHSDDWALLYQDSLAQIWGRRDVFGNPESPRYFPEFNRQITNEPQEGYVSWPAMPVRTNVPVTQIVRAPE
ncbi:MAG: hypothetical protein KDA66_06495 [Planctomycetaceae bacterium]|nr:hypothetical protein [Planctomycetaceae bacterium]